MTSEQNNSTLTPMELPEFITRSDVIGVFEHLHASRPAPDPDLNTMIRDTRRWVDNYADPASRVPSAEVVARGVRGAGVAGEWLIPRKFDEAQRIVYVHGGAWIAGSLDSHRAIAAELARCSGCPVFLVNYRLAPEHPFPAGLNDCVDAVAWVWKNGPGHRSTATSLALVGDSAGGNLAAAACIDIIEKNKKLPSRLALLSPALDTTSESTASAKFDPIVNAPGMVGAMALYLQGAVTSNDPLVSPMYATDKALTKFPPTLIQSTQMEHLYSDAERFSQRLRDANVRTVLSVWPGMTHVWQYFLSKVPEAKQAMLEVAAFCRSD
jgi:acetyl esterase/lipase